MPDPILIYLDDDLWFREAGCMCVNANASRVYLGGIYSMDPERRNLIVLKLDATGMVGEPVRYADNAFPLPPGGRSYVRALLLNEAGKKLYVSTLVDYPGVPTEARPAGEPQVLTVWDLDASGDPIGSPRTFTPATAAYQLDAMALHPTLPLLYLVGFGDDGAVRIYQTDASGEPQGTPEVAPLLHSLGHQTGNKRDLAVSPDGKRLYLGSDTQRVWIQDLDAAGKPVAGGPREFTAATPVLGYFWFHFTPKALYQRRLVPEGEGLPKQESLVVWPLDPTSGDPDGPGRVLPEFGNQAIGVDPLGNHLWIAVDESFTDSYTGNTIRAGVVAKQLTPGTDGVPSSPGTTAAASRRFRQGAVLFAVAANGTPVLLTRACVIEASNQVRDYHVRATVVEARKPAGPAQTHVDVWIGPPGGLELLETNHPVDTPSRVYALDKLLKDRQGQAVLWVRGDADGVIYDPFEVLLEVFEGDPGAGGVHVKSLRDVVRGNVVIFLLPGYGFMEPGSRESDVETLSEHAGRYLQAAEKVKVVEAERPKKFVISCYHMMGGGQGHLGQLKTQAQAMALLGINTAITYNWHGLETSVIDGALRAVGLGWRSAAAYTPLQAGTGDGPLTYFDFYLKRHAEDLRDWCDFKLQEMALQNGGTAADLVDFKMADEPGWYYPDKLCQIRNSTEYLTEFQDFLKKQGLPVTAFHPADTPSNELDWAHVRPVSGAMHADLWIRRRYFWTMRFFAESAARGLALAAAAMEKAVGHPLTIDVNWNNAVSLWYISSPNQKIAHNPDVGPESAMGQMDWFASGRLSAHTIWTEDMFRDSGAQYWSLYGDALRSVARLGTQKIGGYVHGAYLRWHDAGASYKILSLIGHGAKTVDLYTFGPAFFFGDAWSEHTWCYKPIADALRLVGRAEHLLYPGRPDDGQIAMLVTGSSGLWDDNPDNKHYNMETLYLHHALVHAGYTVDFLDDEAVAGGELTRRGYRALYVTGPNVAAAAQTEIAAWVQNGGTLALTPGAAVADEYNEPTSGLDAVLGLKPRRAARTVVSEPTYQLSGQVAFLDSQFGTGSMPLFGPILALEPAAGGATVVGQFPGGEAGVTNHPHGTGRAIAWGFFPGWQYGRSAAEDPMSHRLPYGWGKPQRNLAVAPARIGDTPRPIRLSHELVEACRLTSGTGTAVVLLNWSDRPIELLTVTISGMGAPSRVSTTSGAAVVPRAVAGNLELDLPLKHVDILLLE